MRKRDRDGNEAPADDKRNKYNRYCFTINMPDDFIFDTIDDLPPIVLATDTVKGAPMVSHYRWQWERGADKGRVHVQGCMMLVRRQIATNVVSLLKRAAHLPDKVHPFVRPMWGTYEQSLIYCNKNDGEDETVDDGRIPGTELHDWGVLPAPSQQGARTDIHNAVIAIRDAVWNDGMSEDALIADDNHIHAVAKFPRLVSKVTHTLERGQAQHRFTQYRDTGTRPTVTVLWGDTGCGKTHRAYAECAAAYGEMQLFAWEPVCGFANGYDGHKGVLIDECSRSKFAAMGMSIEQLLTVLDIYPNQLNIKGSSKWMLADAFWLVSNEHYSTWFPTASERQISALKRRFTHVIEMTEPYVVDENNA